MQQTEQANDPKANLNPSILFDKFVQRVQTHLHIILAFSPIGESFRNYLRMYPGLVNCCTIDFFTVKYIILYSEIKKIASPL
jgi:dynein heavy chain